MQQETSLMNLFKMKTVSLTKDHAELSMPITPELYQPFGYLHGGATIALLETAASAAAELNADLETELPLGVDVHVRHRKSGKDGTLHGFADLEQREGSKLFWKVVAYDDEGDVISEGTVVVKVVSKERLAQKERERHQTH